MKPQDMVIAAIHDGMGNQMFQYAMGRVLADRLGVPLKLDNAASKAHPTRPYMLDRFSIRAADATQGEVRSLAAQSPVRRTLDRVLGKRTKRNSATCFHERLFYHYDPEVETLRAPVYVDGYWQSLRYVEPARSSLVQELAIREPPDAATRSALERVTACDAVCVHVRRGDYLSDEVFHLLPPEYYEQAAREIRTRLPSSVFVVFSDDPAGVRASLRLPEPVLWASDFGERSAVEDLRLMSACKHFVIANSTFSWWPAWLSDHPGKRVIAPARWFRNPAWDASQLRPPEWMAL